MIDAISTSNSQVCMSSIQLVLTLLTSLYSNLLLLRSTLLSTSSIHEDKMLSYSRS